MAEDFNFIYFENGFHLYNPVRVFFGPGMLEQLGFDGFASYEIIPQGSEFEITLATI